MNALLLSPRKLGRLLLLVISGAVALASFEHAWARLQARVSEPGRGADWIWAADIDPGDQRRAPETAGFYTSRDFELEHIPPAAWLEIVADEAYVLYLNGRWLGAGTYRSGEPADLYPVESLLRQGNNRIAVELRSVRGVGGLLASLRIDGSDRPLLKSDGGWKIYRRAEPALFNPEQPLAGGKAPQVWGGYATGRWRVAPAVERALPQPPQQALRVRNPHPKARWADLRAKRRQFPGLGPLLIFDWGKTVTGHLTLQFEPTVEPALLYCGDQIPEPDPGRDPATLIVRPVPGTRHWTSSRVLRFRYCLSVGLPIDTPPQVEPVGDGQAVPYSRRKPRGVWGLEPPLRPTSQTPAAVWQRVHEDLRRRAEERQRQRAAREGPEAEGAKAEGATAESGENTRPDGR